MPIANAFALMFAATLAPAERSAFAAMLAPRGALLLFGWLVGAVALGVLGRLAHQRWVAAPARLAERARVLVADAATPHGASPAATSPGSSPVAEAAAPPGSSPLAADSAERAPALRVEPAAAGTRALAAVIEALVRQRDALRADMQARVAEASREIERERSRLAALMAELTQSVVVCNLDGRILLYNNRARLQFRALSSAPALTDGGELIGLGRSIYAVFDRQLVAHALESIQQRLQRGAAHPSAQFVTGTQGGQLLRVQMAPVREIGDDAAALNGFVLMLDNITRDFDAESRRDRLLHGLTEGSRAALGNLQAAVEMLDYPDVDAATRERFQGVIRDEVRTMSERLRALAAQSAETLKARWPLEDMLGADLVAAAVRRIEAQAGCRAAAGEVERELWLQVDSYSLLQAVVCLAGRLVGEHDVRLVTLRLARAGARARLDLVWSGPALSTETLAGWETEPMRIGGDTLALTVRDVVERHDGAFWFERERVRHEAFFRFLLPLAPAGDPLDSQQLLRSGSRPEYYDFDLFERAEPTRELAERSLAELAYTVFDTETTGLDPAGGDEIIQIGATRIVGGKLRRQECFEQLVDPGRSIGDASIAVHGIRPEMLVGQPTLDAVLPAFHAFARDTVLVAHNAAFDLRFLQLKEAATGVVFDQPLLDTLLLSELVHPQQASHGLEAIAERFGVAVLGRHTALGDAIVTAEVFVKLIPLLAERGIRTLGEALDAARRTRRARITY
jgi:DNA polymerase-3 subunit epsilon